MTSVIHNVINRISAQRDLAKKSPLFFSALILLPIILTNSSIALAEDKNTSNHPKFSKEPIQPIPQHVEFDKSKASLGKSLFFNPRLSTNNSISCASCHHLESGGDDNTKFGISLSAEQHIINTPSIFNAQFNFKQNWNGSAKTLGKQIENVIENHHEFNNSWEVIVSRLVDDASLRKNFNKTYKNGITKENIIDALVEFEKTLFTPNSRFDQYLRNEIDLSNEEKQGYALFKSLGCVSCHQGINVGGNIFQKFGVFYNYLAEQGNIEKADYGRYNITQRKFDKFVFKVPSLRNIAVTAPYLHNGSAKTLEDAIRIMGSTQLGRELNDDTVSMIKTFLNTLTGEYKNNLLSEAL